VNNLVGNYSWPRCRDGLIPKREVVRVVANAGAPTPITGGHEVDDGERKPPPQSPEARS
jgi:hypothetical protein